MSRCGEAALRSKPRIKRELGAGVKPCTRIVLRAAPLGLSFGWDVAGLGEFAFGEEELVHFFAEEFAGFGLG